MEIYKTQSTIAKKSNWLLSMVVTLLVTIGVLFLLQGLSLILVIPLFQVSITEIIQVMTGQSTAPNGRMAILFIQGIGTGFGFIAATLLIAKLVDKADMGFKQHFDNFKFIPFLIMIFVILGGMMFNTLLIDLNGNFQFPSFMAEFEKMLQQKEAELMALTIYLTDFDSIQELMMGVLVIGVLAGLGEELFFRGLLQPKLHQYTGNMHVGVWLTAFIFSAIHMQFYGFLPRMLLGAIFGYLYCYSGSLIYPIIAHIFNNTFTIVLVYLGKLGKIDFDIEEVDQASWPVALGGLALLVISLKLFSEKNKPNLTHEKLE
ncbi:CPBP family intramembrane glutamic endopeptidase [Belliella kenyensis]|uniref:CPBP family intramembrane glutamic endopeptidase n=1 Tax=Belliella kenyensis TaxID=1472724 RepID=A0ABV8EPG8_9BACT|nr:CPBP family intramembrane glutamic endopeptidase [Belliella kenyensis]MCH7402501.1 CPBP family intramembrane metalloprotease [Belliella kenyensis]MDN3603300.1 CPBP family intramembrane metalloprotease [Belliella kenyensis]